MESTYGEDYSERVIRGIVRYARDTHELAKDLGKELNKLKYGGLDGGIIYLTRIAYDILIFSIPENDPELTYLKKERKNYCDEINSCETKKGYSRLTVEGIKSTAKKMIERVENLEARLKK